MRPSVVAATNFVPPAPSVSRATSESQRDQAQAAAFRELDGPIADCKFMAKIAAQLMSGADDGKNPELVFAVFHVSDMLSDLKSRYEQMYDSRA